MSVTIKFDQSPLDAVLDRIAAKSDASVRPAAQAGAEHLYYEARLRCPVSDHAHFFHGTQYKKDGTKYYFTPGTLRDSIYQVYSKDNSGQKHATYHVAWNHQKAPYGFMVEFGTKNAPAHPWLRPAYEAAKVEALQIAKGTYAEQMQEVLR